MTEAAAGLDQFEALLSPPGQELLSSLAGQDIGQETALRLGTSLRQRYPASLVASALAQHELRQRARSKFSHADQMYFTRDGLEQASSELIAARRASRLAAAVPRDGTIADLCCGIGGDLLALARHRRALAVDIDPLHLRMALINAAAASEPPPAGQGVAISPLLSDVRADAVARALGTAGAIFIDPARRAGGHRLSTGASEPPLSWALALTSGVPAVAVKAAPGLDPALIPSGWELEFIAIGRELKEAVAWSPALATARRRATILPGGHVLAGPPASTAGADADADGAIPVRAPGEFLCDPNPAVTRAGLVESLARDLGAWKIDARIAFLSADQPIRTPFGRSLRVIDSAPWNEKQLRTRLRALGVGAVDVRRRGLAGDVDTLRRRLKLTGDLRATLVMTRVSDRPWALICVEAG